MMRLISSLYIISIFVYIYISCTFCVDQFIVTIFNLRYTVYFFISSSIIFVHLPFHILIITSIIVFLFVCKLVWVFNRITFMFIFTVFVFIIHTFTTNNIIIITTTAYLNGRLQVTIITIVVIIAVITVYK